MKSIVPGAIARAAGLGFTAGLRSQLPLALLARNAGSAGPALFANRFIASGLYLSAAGEIMLDKLPALPSRLEAGPLSGRLLFGSVGGGLLARRRAAPVVAGVIFGAAGALAGSFAGYHSRTWLGQHTPAPDTVSAVLEDAVALSLGSAATRT